MSRHLTIARTAQVRNDYPHLGVAPRVEDLVAHMLDCFEAELGEYVLESIQIQPMGDGWFLFLAVARGNDLEAEQPPLVAQSDLGPRNVRAKVDLEVVRPLRDDVQSR